jgi:hypothetical protein
MSTEEMLKTFEARLVEAGFAVNRTGSNPVSFRLSSGGKNVGQARVWAPLKAKFNEVRDQWRDGVKACWKSAEGDGSGTPGGDGGHWQAVDRLLAQFAPYRRDFLDFEDLASAVIAALRKDRLPAPDIETLRYDFFAIETAARSRGKQ